MSYIAPSIAWASIIPMLVVFGAAVVGILIESFVRNVDTRRTSQLALGVVAIVSSIAIAITQWVTLDGAGTEIQRGMMVVDRQSLAWQVLILVFALLALLLFADRSKSGEDAFAPLASVTPGSLEEDIAHKRRMQITEVFPFLLFATGGMMLFTAVNDLLFLFVALEVFSLPLYILVALSRRRRLLSQEASLKYFLLGAFSSAIMLFGIVMIYGGSTVTTYRSLEMAYQVFVGRDPLIVVGIVLLLVGLFFKIGAAPFHQWTPDVYQGAPTPVTAFMSAATKAAAVAALLRLIYSNLYLWEWEITPLIWIVAITSMAVGSVVALVQVDIKRMLAYSSVAHAGFILVALAGFSPDALSALPFYLLAYGLASIGAFAIITQVRQRNADGALTGEASRLGQWAGLGKRSPFLAAAMAVFLLSFAGIPLTAGFVGKFVAFRAAVSEGAWPLVLIAVLASAVAAFFYVRLIVLMFFTSIPEGEEDTIAVTSTPLTRAVIVFALVATVVLGVVPGLALDAASDAGVLQVATLGS